jgi:hypothetical protein
VANGTSPLTYQWFLDAEPISGETNGVLRIETPANGDAGTYTVLVSNAYGQVLSSEARLRVDFIDSDSDGTPDDWMNQHFGHATGMESDQSRAADDPDGDGMSNLQEYWAGTDPKNAGSSLRLFYAQGPDGSPTLGFEALAYRAYTIQRRLSLDGPWLNYQSVPAEPQARFLQFEPPTSGTTQSFFRVLTWTQ